MSKRRKRLFSVLMTVMIAALAGCVSPTESEIDSVGEPVSSIESAAITEETVDEESNIDGVEKMTSILLDFGDTIVTADLDNSETSQAFIKRLPLTISMSRYADREYYAAIPDFENGDITYYTTGSSLAIFFGNAGQSSQDGLIRMGKITSDLSAFEEIGNHVEVTISLAEGSAKMTDYNFSDFSNVELIGVELTNLSDDEFAVLYQQARYCQAMTEADIAAMREMVSEDMLFTHMSGRQQSREEYFADIENGSLTYFTIGIDHPVVEVDGDSASVTYTSVLNANAYGARGTYRMDGTHWYEKRDGQWISVNAPSE